MTATDIAIVGVGKIARDQHVPSIGRSEAFNLAATVSSHGGVNGVENHATLEGLLKARPDIPAVALCMPPQHRFAAAKAALSAGRHVLLEKPPGATVAEVHALKALAERQGVTLFATWHSRFAAGVEPARRWLGDKTLRHVRVTWKEDVRRWHPGQEWIWQPGGLGVFDPGINALSIVTAILPFPVHMTTAELKFPENREAPIAAALAMTGNGNVTVEAEFDWRHTGAQTWTIEVDTTEGRLVLADGGATLAVADEPPSKAPDREYDAIYGRFAELLTACQIDADFTPLVHVADAFMLGRRVVVEPFFD